MDFGELLTHFRTQSGLTTRQLEDLTGIDQSYFTKWQNRTLPPPDRVAVLKTALALAVTPNQANRLLHASQHTLLTREEKLQLNFLRAEIDPPAREQLLRIAIEAIDDYGGKIREDIRAGTARLRDQLREHTAGLGETLEEFSSGIEASAEKTDELSELLKERLPLEDSEFHGYDWSFFESWVLGTEELVASWDASGKDPQYARMVFWALYYMAPALDRLRLWTVRVVFGYFMVYLAWATLDFVQTSATPSRPGMVKLIVPKQVRLSFDHLPHQIETLVRDLYAARKAFPHGIGGEGHKG
jgi:transcriptional regulator with XRE-family HTH domain